MIIFISKNISYVQRKIKEKFFPKESFALIFQARKTIKYFIAMQFFELRTSLIYLGQKERIFCVPIKKSFEIHFHSAFKHEKQMGFDSRSWKILF